MRMSIIGSALLTSLASIGIALAADLPASIGGHPIAKDGDEFELSGYDIRFHGIAPPEDDGRTPEPGGREATTSLAQIVKSKFVLCKPDGTYWRGRAMAVCSFLREPPTSCRDDIIDGRPARVCVHDEEDIGQLQVLAGHARDCPSLSKGQYAAAEAEARAAGRDLSKIFPLPGYCVPR
jgi:endonuclease YncB( thermonuclease family)